MLPKRPCPRGLDKPLATELQARSVTESGSNKLCLPHLSPSILYALTATTFHSSGRAVGHEDVAEALPGRGRIKWSGMPGLQGLSRVGLLRQSACSPVTRALPAAPGDPRSGKHCKGVRGGHPVINPTQEEPLLQRAFLGNLGRKARFGGRGVDSSNFLLEDTNSHRKRF